MRITISTPQVIFEQGHRANQEDYVYPRRSDASNESRLFVLCDGMGGHEHGEVASETVATALAHSLEQRLTAGVLTDDQLQEAIDHAYRQLDTIDDGAFRKAGTTMTLLALHQGGATVAHIGDSRIYHLRPRARTILYISRDHSLVFELYQAGEITREQMKTHPRKNQVTRAMIPGDDNRVRADVMHTTDLQAGDYFVLCSDGMLEQMDDEELLALLASDLTDEQKRKRLEELTADNADNHSAILVHIAAVEPEQGDDRLPNDEQTVRFNAMNIHPQFVADIDDDVRIVNPQPKKAGWLQRLKNYLNH